MQKGIEECKHKWRNIKIDKENQEAEFECVKCNKKSWYMGGKDDFENIFIEE